MITGKVLRVEQRVTVNTPNIAIIVEFSDDGIVIAPEWVLWAKYENFIGMTPLQISEWIRINIESQIGNFIKAKHREALNTTIMAEIDKLAGTEITTDKVEIPMMATKVIPTAYVVELKDDGTYTVKTGVPVVEA